jgi:hypothetical protein
MEYAYKNMHSGQDDSLYYLGLVYNRRSGLDSQNAY